MTRAAHTTDPARITASTAVAAVGIHQLAITTETNPNGPLHQLSRSARTELGRPRTQPPITLATTVIGLGAIARGTTKQERQIAHALMAFRALLQAWSQHDRTRTSALTAQTETAIRRYGFAGPGATATVGCVSAGSPSQDSPLHRATPTMIHRPSS